ncbi:hypothetical protein D3C72_1936170 [compost metagenome]
MWCLPTPLVVSGFAGRTVVVATVPNQTAFLRRWKVICTTSIPPSARSTKTVPIIGSPTLVQPRANMATAKW